jgi:uncharacterized protein YndB with AHSA1/START domain
MENAMFEIIVIVAIVLAIVIAIVLILAAARPDTFRVERAAAMSAPAEKIFGLIDDFHAWQKWSPWEGRDPAMQRTFGGAERGSGAVYAWEGNKNVGSGRMEIVDAATSSRIVIKLDFLKPFEAHNVAEFTLTPQGGTTNVNWAMHGPAPLMFRVMHMVMNMDRIVGKDFEAGLANLKQVAER